MFQPSPKNKIWPLPEVKVELYEQDAKAEADQIQQDTNGEGVTATRDRSDTDDSILSDCSMIDGARFLPPPHAKSKIAFWLELFRRRRDACIRRSVFGRRLPMPCWPRFDGRYSVAEIATFIIVIGVTIGACVWAIVVDKPQPPRQLAQWALFVTLALATHNSVLNLLLGLPFDRRLFWHKLFAFNANALGWTHGALAIKLWGFTGIEDNPHRQEMMYSGLALASICALFFIFSNPIFRRKLWNFFWACHLLLTIGLVVAAVFHLCYYSLIGGFDYTGFGLLLIDYILRYLYMAMLAHPNEAQAAVLPSRVTRLTMPRPTRFSYEAGQYVFVMIPKLSLYEWHPFTLSSAPHSRLLTVHIRALGDWSTRVNDLAVAHTKKLADGRDKSGDDPESGQPVTEDAENIQVYVEGPYGSPEINIFGNRYKLVCLISAGIGITPMQSIGNHLLHEYRHGRRNLNRLRFIWSTPDTSMLNAVFEHDRQWAGYLNELDTDTQVEPTVTSKRKQTKQRGNSVVTASTTISTVDGHLATPTMSRTNSETSLGSLASMYPNNASDVLRMDLHLTKIKSESELPDDHSIPESLSDSIRFGRPDYEQLLKRMKNEAIELRRKRVAVLVCGPKLLVQQVRHICARLNSDGRGKYKVHFDFHAELFEF